MRDQKLTKQNKKTEKKTHVQEFKNPLLSPLTESGINASLRVDHSPAKSLGSVNSSDEVSEAI